MNNASVLQSFFEQLLPDALQVLERMVGINSFTGNPAGVNELARFTAECFEPLGFASLMVPSTNREFGAHLVLTRKGTGSASLALISHLDTVFPPEEEARNNFHWQREGDRIYGPGTEDIKGGTVMIWLVLQALRRFAPEVFEQTTWKILLNSSEERFSPDFGDLCRAQFEAGTRAALVFEAEGRLGEESLLVVARKGRATWRVSCSGRGAHAGGKHPQGANAIVQLGHLLPRLAALTDYQRNITFNPGAIGGGTVLNRVPHEAWVEGEFRAFSPADYEHAKTQLLELAGPGSVSSPADGFHCRVEVAILSESRPWPRNASTDALYEYWADAAGELNLKVNRQERGGLSDGNLIWDAVPTLDGLGPWGDNDHCSERSPDGSKMPEYVLVSSFVPKAMLNYYAISRLLGARSA